MTARRRGRRLALIAAAAVALLLGGVATWWLVLRPPALPPGVVAVSGRIEGDDSAIASKTSGRIREITVREGDVVKAGDIIAILDDDQIRAREQQAEAAVQQAEARLRVSEQQMEVVGEQLRQSELGVDQARTDAKGKVSEAEGRLAAAEAQLAQADASYAQARWDRDAARQLYERGLIAEQEVRRSESNEQAQSAIVAASRRQVEAARGALTAAQANLVNPALRTSQLAAVRVQLTQARSDILAARADADRARAQLDEARANRKDLAVVAPFSGTVATRTAEPGEVVTAGTPIITLIDLGRVYLRGFIPEGQIGRVRLGQAARVYLDSAPTKPIEAVVMRIDPQATFTPENTYFREERVKQVVGVKVLLRGAEGFAKPGMPADGEILVEGAEWPARRGLR
ncbi:MAG TPA: HlyD family efflux transporter periplasmic adaptor subunit [Methylomirabilota bacterium]|nr:HlyD family efflux transporter periplasmic adaptor subunit [Methylomirabilota bacterium]